MKVLHYIPTLGEKSGGVGSYMQLLARDLGKLCELHVVTRKDDDMLMLENCEVHFVDESIWKYAKVKKDFIALLKEINPDVVHSNCCWAPYSALCVRWAKSLGYITVLTPHGMLEPWIMKRNYWMRKLPALMLYQLDAIKQADMLHATADSEKENLLSLGWNRNIRVIGNCVQIDKIPMKISWERTGRILFLSRIHEKKGIEFLIEAVARIKEMSKPGEMPFEVDVVGIGEADYIDELKQYAQRLGVDDKIHFPGAVFGDRKFELYRNADLFVLPTHSENFGIVVAEALASGTPVVTTKGTPWNELNTHQCGWWVEVGTKALVEALMDFMSKSSEELELMGRRGRSLIEGKYSSVAIAQQFAMLYEELSL